MPEIATGSQDIPLTPEGHAKSMDIGERFANEGGIDMLLASPLRRAQQTAGAIHAFNPQAVVPDISEGLRPWALGAIEGYPEEYVNKLLPTFVSHPDRPLAGRSASSTMNGESFNSWAGTYFPTIKALMNYVGKNPDHKVVAVTHSRNIALTNDWLQKDQPTDYSKLSLDTKKIKSDGVFRVNGKGVVAARSVKDPGLYLVEHGKTEHSA